MAYFSNSTEGDIFYKRYCSRCVHDVNLDCKVWLLHLIYNGGEGDIKNALDTLISPNWFNGEDGCSMFIEVKE